MTDQDSVTIYGRRGGSDTSPTFEVTPSRLRALLRRSTLRLERREEEAAATRMMMPPPPAPPPLTTGDSVTVVKSGGSNNRRREDVDVLGRT